MFDKVFGQDKIFEHLRELITENKAPGSYLLTGPKGIGKWAYGHLFTAAVCCEDDTERPCGKCRSCSAAQKFKHPDIQVLFPFANLEPSKKQVTVFPFADPTKGARFSQAAAEEVQRFLEEKRQDPFRIVRFSGKPNIPVDVLKDLRKFLRLRPMWGGNRAVVISDIENMAPRCADMFLKTIEEPPPDTVIVLTSSCPERLPATILSRCRVFTLQAPDEEDVRDYLQLHFGAEKQDHRFITKASRFSPGLARSLVEEGAAQLRDTLLGLMSSAAKGGGSIDRQFTKYQPEFNVAGTGVNAVTLLSWMMRDIIVMHNGGNADHIVNCDRAEIMARLAGRISSERAGHFLEEVNDIKLACEASNVMPMTAFRHLLALIKRDFALSA